MANIFNHRPKRKPVIQHNLPLVRVAIHSTDEDGVDIVNYKYVPLSEYQETVNLPKPSDYKLKDLIEAGVPLQEVATSGLLDSSDFFDTSIARENMSGELLDKLQEFERARSSQEPPPVVVSKTE